MSGILLVGLQIILLLLRAHFNRDGDHEKAMDAIKQAQGMLAQLANSFETKTRYSAPLKADIDRLEDELDKDKHDETITNK